MKRILLLLSTTRKSPDSIAQALELAKKDNAELILVFILDDAFTQSIVNRISEDGWVGGKTSDTLQNTILKEYFAQGQEKLREVELMADSYGVPHRSIYARGEFTGVALGIIQKEQPDLLIVTRRKRSDLSRFVFGSAVAELQAKAPCEIMVIDE
ncbi:MAG: universal stress protein [Candidatus Schekmanbacteria bacterium]|nr:universal stress protein [Candidatus Schekmanbacteria bacterium]